MKIVGWIVKLYLWDIYTGRYEFGAESDARTFVRERERMFGVLGFHYRVKPLVRLIYGGAA